MSNCSLKTRVIPLTQGYSTIVDCEDFEVLSQHRWKILKAGKKRYACRGFGSRKRGYTTFLMHRIIMGDPVGLLVDHWDGDGLNNRRTNLRTCTQTQNSGNMQNCKGGASKYKGVYLSRGLWHAQISAGFKSDGKQNVVFLGRYAREDDAATAYDRKAREIHGEFACTNFPEDDGRTIERSMRPSVHHRGDKNGAAKITDEAAMDVYRRAISGEPQALIAMDHGISKQLVSAIKNGVARSHIAGILAAQKPLAEIYKRWEDQIQ